MEDEIIPENSETCQQRKAILRKDKLRKSTRKKSNAEMTSQENEANGNDNEALDKSPRIRKQDSVHETDGTVEQESDDDSNPPSTQQSEQSTEIPETGSTDQEPEGINDSLTNLTLLGGVLYTAVSAISRQLWYLLRATVNLVISIFTAPPAPHAPTEGGPPGHGPDSSVDPPDEPVKSAGQGEDIVDAARQTRLYNIANELMTTERQYVKRLGVLETLKVQTGSMLSIDVAKAIFQNIEVIHQFHRDNLLPELQARIENWNSIRKIGDIMKKLTPFLKLYTEYVKNYESANSLLLTWRQKNNSFDRLMKDAENNAEYGRLKVQAHMLEPIQRVPRYELLLRDYLRKLPENSPDRQDTEKALVQVAKAASHFEDMMERDSRIVEQLQLQRQFEGDVQLVHCDRNLLYRGKLRLISSKSGKMPERTVHLFNDLLLISSEVWNIGGSKFKVKHSFNLYHTKIGYGINLEVNNVFYLSSKNIGVVELVATSSEERFEWMDRIDHELRECARKNGLSHCNSFQQRGYMYEMDWCKKKEVYHISSDHGKSWRKRTLAVYNNGLMTCLKSTSDSKPLAVVELKDFSIALGSIPSKKGKVCIMVGEGKTYHIHDDGRKTIEKLFDDVKSFQMSGVENDDHPVQLRRETSDTISIDSGIDMQTTRPLSAFAGGDTSWTRASLTSTESEITEDSESVISSSYVLRQQSTKSIASQRDSGLSAYSGLTENGGDGNLLG